MVTVNYKIKAGEETLSCVVDYFDETKQPDIICLHGGGPTNKDTIKYLSVHLQTNGNNVIRFDFSGQGESTGNIKHSSLIKRIEEARSVLEYFKIDKEITIIGTSMGAYIACALTEFYKTSNLILFCPAAYSRKARLLRFDSGFSEVIREKNSFLETDIINILQNYKNKAMLLCGTKDEIIPKEVIQIYKDSLCKADKFQFVGIPDCPHSIHVWLDKKSEIQEKIKKYVIEFVHNK